MEVKKIRFSLYFCWFSIFFLRLEKREWGKSRNFAPRKHDKRRSSWENDRWTLVAQTDSRCSVMRLRCKVFANHYPIRRLQSRSSGWDMEERPAQRRQAGREKNVKREILTWQYSDVSTWWNYSEVPYWDETMSIISFTKCIFRLLNCNLKQ